MGNNGNVLYFDYNSSGCMIVWVYKIFYFQNGGRKKEQRKENLKKGRKGEKKETEGRKKKGMISRIYPTF